MSRLLIVRRTPAIIRRLLILSAVFLPPAGVPLPGQQATTFSTDVKVVGVLATVRNKQGRLIRDLNKDDFVLEEDGRPQAIRYFSRETDLPLTLGLLVDTSLSQRRVLGEERTASYRFLDQVLREEKDMAFVIHFDREVELLQDLTSSRKLLESALSKLETPPMRERGAGGPSGGGYPQRGRYPGGGGGRRGGGTALYDSVLLASDELMKKQSGRKALIVLCDGVDTGSKVSLAEGIAAAQHADTLVYSILFSDPEAYNPGFGGRPGIGRRGGYGGRRFPEQRPDGRKILQQISRETGGGFFEVWKKQPIEQIFDRIQEELRNQYSLGYTPDRLDAGPGFRKISLAVKQAGLAVQARDGYYAGP